MKKAKKLNSDGKYTVSIILILLFFYFSENAFAQTEYGTWHPAPKKDFETWAGASFEKKLRNKTFIIVAPKIRFNKNSSDFKSFFSNFNIYYRYKKYLRFSFCYRITRDLNEYFHRFYGQVFYKNEIIKNLRFTYRGRIEREYSSRNLPDNAFRNKIVLDYKFSKTINPFFASEIIYKIHYKGNHFNKIRFDFGFVFDLGKRKELSLFYRYQKEINERSPLQTNIIGINYAYSFK